MLDIRVAVVAMRTRVDCLFCLYSYNSDFLAAKKTAYKFSEVSKGQSRFQRMDLQRLLSLTMPYQGRTPGATAPACHGLTAITPCWYRSRLSSLRAWDGTT